MKRTIAILLAVIILIMNLGLSVNNHFCSGKLASSSLTVGFGDAGCGMENGQASCEAPMQSNSLNKVDCCDTRHVQLQVEDDYNETNVSDATINLKFVALFVISYYNDYFLGSTQQENFFAYSPPILERDLEVLNQVFLL